MKTNYSSHFVALDQGYKLKIWPLDLQYPLLQFLESLISGSYVRLKFLIAWPSREMCPRNMSSIFKELYPMCRCIIDCSEVFIETPNNYKARSSTYSNYKKNNTVKFLIGITPFGTISFVSQSWGGRVSDKTLTQQSGFLEKLEHGDLILANRGFTIADDVGLYGAKLVIPAFTRGKAQLSQRDVEMSKKLSQARRKSNWVAQEQVSYFARKTPHNFTKAQRRCNCM